MEDLDALDRVCADYMGIRFRCGADDPDECWRDDIGTPVPAFRPTRSPTDCISLIVRLWEDGLEPEVSASNFYDANEPWCGTVWEGAKDYDGRGPSPMVALAQAVAAWRKSLLPPAPGTKEVESEG